MHLRVARHTNNLELIIEFYTEILNLEILGKFIEHDGYDGVFIGKESLNWHLEFTSSNERTNHQTDDDDLLVVYPEREVEYANILKKIENYNITRLMPKNSYWQVNGVLIKDPDGFNIIISRQKITGRD